MGVERTLEWYGPGTREMLAGEIALKDISLEDLRPLFGVTETSPDPLMYTPYPVVTPQQVAFFETLLGMKLDLRHYSYYVGCYRHE